MTAPAASLSLVQRLIKQHGAAKLYEMLTPEQRESLPYEWDAWARPEQILPPGDWSTWLVLAGRGFGKTRVGAETTRMAVEKAARGMSLAVASGRVGRIALIGRTSADVRDTLVDGESGIRACAPAKWMPKYEPSKRRLVWPNGAQAICYAADKPDQLRGPQHHIGWADELASWRYQEQAWSNFQMGLRLGRHPWSVVTTTPRPTRTVRNLIAGARNIGRTCAVCKAPPFQACVGPHAALAKCRRCRRANLSECIGHPPTTVISTGSMYDNESNLPDNFLEEITRQYEGTRLGRQEIYAEVLDDIAGALWNYAQIEADTITPEAAPDTMRRVLVAIDPPKTSNEAGVQTWSNMCGIVVVGSATIAAGDKKVDGGFVLEDGSDKLTPHEWGTRTVNLYREYEADAIVAEVNTGYEKVKAVIHGIDPNVRIIPVTSRRGKILRAEPVAALYEQRRVKHVGSFPELEDQMCQFTPAMTSSSQSPDRLDALVHGLTELLISPSGGAPKVWRAR